MEYNFKDQHELFFSIIKRLNFKEQEELESYVHALVDIEESIVKIYSVLTKEIITNQHDDEYIKEKMWDIREEFRHIEYHIQDAKLTE